mmetsp:Transcript_23373/g.65220  ORF Transcript_23373/g.65220 Transcript_23373/m.65220 type:complete len:330 (+) Transcript_23373:528-1517(+)
MCCATSRCEHAVIFLREDEAWAHALLVVEVVNEGFWLLPSDVLKVLGVSHGALVDAGCLHLLPGGGITELPLWEAALRDVFLVVVESELDVLNFLAVALAEDLDHLRVLDGAWAGDVVDLVAVRLHVEKHDHGSLGDVVGADVVDAHAVGSRDELLLLAEQVSLDQQGRCHVVGAAKDGVRHAAVALGLLEKIVAGSVEGDEGDVLAVLASDLGHALEVVLGSEEGDLDEVLHLGVLAAADEGWEHVGPVLDVRNAAEDCLDSLHGLCESAVIGPVEIHEAGAQGCELLDDLFDVAALKALTSSLPDAHADVLVASFQQSHGHAISDQS